MHERECVSKIGDGPTAHLLISDLRMGLLGFEVNWADPFHVLLRVDPHTGIAAKLLDESINLYQGIA